MDLAEVTVLIATMKLVTTNVSTPDKGTPLGLGDAHDSGRSSEADAVGTWKQHWGAHTGGVKVFLEWKMSWGLCDHREVKESS